MPWTQTPDGWRNTDEARVMTPAMPAPAPPMMAAPVMAPQAPPRDDVRYGGYGLEEVARAIMQQESSGGTNVGPRPEPGFEAKYGKKWLSEGDTAFRRQAIKQHGREAVYSSYGPYQVMFPVAVELGYQGTPKDLADPAVNRLFFERKLARDWKGSGGDLDQTFLRYNGGGDKDYAKKIRAHLKSQQATEGGR